MPRKVYRAKGAPDLSAVITEQPCSECGVFLYRVTRAIFTWLHCPICD